MEGVGNQIVLSGSNAYGREVTSLFNTADGSEVVLLDADQGIEVQFLRHLASQNTVLFHGLRESDSEYVLGEIDLATGAVTYIKTVRERFRDFVTF